MVEPGWRASASKRAQARLIAVLGYRLIASLGSTLSVPRARVDTNWHFIDNFSAKLDRNEIKFGYEFRRTFVNAFFDAGYRGRHRGGQGERDAAYHQGTVWPWLIGHFADATLRAGADAAAVRPYLDAFPRHLRDAGVGSISEIFDAEPPYWPRGCIAQAWSVAEVLRAWLRTEPSGESLSDAAVPAVEITTPG